MPKLQVQIIGGPGSGKTTLAIAFKAFLEAQGITVEVKDYDLDDPGQPNVADPERQALRLTGLKELGPIEVHIETLGKNPARLPQPKLRGLGDAPQPLAIPDFSGLARVIVDGINEATAEGYMNDHFEHEVYEKALEVVYGPSFWPWYNQRDWEGQGKAEIAVPQTRDPGPDDGPFCPICGAEHEEPGSLGDGDGEGSGILVDCPGCHYTYLADRHVGSPWWVTRLVPAMGGCAFHVGQEVRIKPDGWARFVQETKSESPNPGTQKIAHLPHRPPFSRVRLTFPLFWFREDEIEAV